MGKISAHECMNRLVEGIYWAVRDVLKGDRKSAKMPERKLHWANTKEKVVVNFGVSKFYFRSMTQYHRKMYLSDFLGLLHWLHSLVREEERDEVTRLVLHLLKV